MTANEKGQCAVSVIICSRNRPAMLAESIASIWQGDTVPAQLIIVDQSDECNRQLAQRSLTNTSLHYQWSPSVGLSRGNNIGASCAHHDVLVFTHDDVHVAPTWLHNLVGALNRAGDSAVVTGRVLASLEEKQPGYAPALKTDPDPAVYSGAEGIGMLKPMNLALYRTTLFQLGGFDERLGPGTPFPGAEDSDLGFRLLREGYRLVYVPEAVVYHRAWRPEHHYLPLRWQYGIAQGAFYAKHLRHREPWIAHHLFRDVRRRTWRFPYRLLQEPGRALGDPLFLFGNVYGAARWLLTYRRQQNLPESR